MHDDFGDRCFFCGSENISATSKAFGCFMMECDVCGSLGPTKNTRKAAERAYFRRVDRHDMDGVLSCPFCPERAVIKSRFYKDGELKYNIGCLFCNTLLGMCDSELEALDLWNGGASDV